MLDKVEGRIINHGNRKLEMFTDLTGTFKRVWMTLMNSIDFAHCGPDFQAGKSRKRFYLEYTL